MNLNFYRSNYLPGILVGTAAVVTIAICQSAMAKSAEEVAIVAASTTVQINNTLAPEQSGTGVIIAKKGNNYTVLTVNHLVENPNSEYVIFTSKKKEYKVTEVKSFQNNSRLDLAVVMFESDEEYPVAPISNSDAAKIGSGVYVSGYLWPADGSKEREYAFTSGQVTNIRSSNADGYTIRYNAVTRRGMGGGPVFDVSGRVIGIHGQAEMGFNSGIPINTFVEMMSQVGMDKSALKVDDKPAENTDAEEVKESDVDNWAADFGKEILKNVIRYGIRRILPF
jgi:S1-C subfamily serine protease